MAQEDQPRNLAPSEVAAAELGRRLAAIRLARNVTQGRLAREAGVSRRTVTRLENGEGVSLDTLIRVLGALGLADRLARLLPEPGVRPIERVRQEGRERQRARPAARSEPAGWSWADDDDEHGS